ncbi:MAG: hypothetical protein IJQ06_02565 [Paludibacteraceae bacterium]|nr:hypothetical protein [Paludibacteraceae bacterium]
MKRILFLVLAVASSVALSAKKNVKTIHVTPENAKIFVNGQEVGNGTYVYKFDRHTDFIILRFEAPGYITRKNIRLLKDNPKETIAYTLYEDEAFKQSVGSSDGVDIANKWMTITCKKGMTEDKVWRRLMSVAVDNFENVEVRDKAAGWIKTAWKDTNFESGQTVRTRLEVRVMVGGDDEDELSYKIRVSSEIKDSDCFGDECYEKYPRVLRKFYDVLNDMQNSLGANN